MFDRCMVINMDARQDRLRAFLSRVPKEWPFAVVERVPAFCGSLENMPAWYGGPIRSNYVGAWGCFQSHLGIWKRAIADGLDSVFIMEDDCVFVHDFTRLAREFIADVPCDWDQIYFGCQHLRTDTMPPVIVTPRVVQGRNVNRTHAYAIRRPMMEFCIEQFDRQWPPQTPANYYNFDYQLGLLHSRYGRIAYCPRKNLCGQAAGKSSVSTVTFISTCWWNEFGAVLPNREEVSC